MKAQEIKGAELRRLQLIELDMLKEFDRVCRKHGIKYTMDGGTMLGAVRHKGFIPWDDDTDVAMLRAEYEKFKRVAGELDPSVCWFQDHDTDPEYRWGYGKLRRTGTEYVRVGQEHLKCRTGVFVDVFPFDDAPRGIVGQILQDFICFLLRKTLWSEVAKKSDPRALARFVYGWLSRIPPRFVFRILNRYAQRSLRGNAERVRVLALPSYAKYWGFKDKLPLHERYALPRRWLTELTDYEFEGCRLMGMKDYDGFLRFQYRDYMTLPPENDRTARAPVSKFDFAGLHPLPMDCGVGTKENNDAWHGDEDIVAQTGVPVNQKCHHVKYEATCGH